MPAAAAVGSWRIRAACAEAGRAGDWFGDGGPAGIGRALLICDNCRVRRECRDWALRTGERWGVWGGMTPEERKHLRSTIGQMVVG